MIKHKVRILLLLSSLASMIFSGNAMGQASNSSVLSISVSHARVSWSTLSFDWCLRNGSREPIYVYSSFLYGPAALEPVNDKGTIRVRSSLKTPESVGVNAYPPAKFVRIEPGATLAGKFHESKLDRSILREARAVELEVGFGAEVDELKRKISATGRNGEHPANPIVAWQTETMGTADVTGLN